ncbi:MAG: MurR/RpiR family transcriptional regulator [Atopobiaceae bacterium]|jgi:DNA-binding MurR/RpiR family transcriptional regulator|nr:MurR/RpiR family transcriptional regulator [Atopobiaceae bacterium]MCH4181250.1 MurR/RpiR family transcriptional regulator [Atopobiaceae bacterium]MCH4214779.1 MurR/RpiR family transcriptional regulator [Atopobiaceae bacterium]MCH4276833.1 MurR/RpiR family transcriptional regulator [Atopobiaceae bacterium]MCI1226178.1 MurR/RpiR family transcriptional regulator [Atopobiaceae bacterium]
MGQESTVTSQILSSYKRFSDSEQRIANFILTDDEQVSSLMASEIAQKCHTSNTTVSRFVHTLGYESFAQLRLALSREEASRQEPSEGAAVISLDDVSSSMRFYLDQKVHELEDTVASLDPDEVTAITRLLQGAGTVLVVGVGTSLSVAQTAAVKLTHVGIRAISPVSSDAATVLTQLLTGSDCILFISSSGESKRLGIIMDEAADSAIPTAIITGNGASTLARRADHVLAAVSRDRLLAGDFSFSYSSIDFVIELLVLLLFHDSLDVGEYLRIFNKSFALDKTADTD